MLVSFTKLKKMALKNLILFCFFALFFSCQVNDKNTEELTIAVAASLQKKFEKTAKEYEKMYPNSKINILAAASSKIVLQSEHGLPADMLVLADSSLISKLKKALRSDYFCKSSLCFIGKKEFSPDTLADFFKKYPEKKICLPDPQTAPVGKAAKKFLQSLNIDEKSWVFAENASAVLGYVDKGFCEISVSSTLLRTQLPKGYFLHDVEEKGYDIAYFGVLRNKKAEKFYLFAMKQSRENP
jgi:molybdate transport system substrate-binding protein